jgi:hypothetical protein
LAALSDPALQVCGYDEMTAPIKQRALRKNAGRREL